MPAKRRDVRESALILTFEKLLRDDSLEEIFETASEAESVIVNNEVKALVCGIIEKSNEIDEIISKYSDKRAVERIPKINLAVLRLAIYEALYDEKVPVNVAISEAVALVGKYALDSDVSFVNGVLGSYSRSEGAPQNNE